MMHYKELSTPALVIDLDIVERNADRMAAYCSSHSLGLRPHTKTHKTIEIAKMQLKRGALGLTVAKVGEAEVMRQSGTQHILVAYPVLGKEKLKRLAEVAREIDVLIAIDDVATAISISEAAIAFDCTFGLLVEFDAGSRRCGLPPGLEPVRLGQAIEKLAGVRLRGLMTYFGNVWNSERLREQEMARTALCVEEALESFRKTDMPLEIVSGGSTPSAALSHTIPGLTEIRPGTYIFNDMNTYYQGVCGLEDCAARVVSTVVSTAVANQAIVDAGSKTLSYDTLSSGPMTGYGHIVEHPDIPIFRLNEEHGYLDTSQSGPLKVGEVVSIIPNHVCTCVNMHDEVFVMRNKQIVDTWKVAARGKIR
jgi:D-serine deaminase-like pyridoxal phosphate-dependent protein